MRPSKSINWRAGYFWFCVCYVICNMGNTEENKGIRVGEEEEINGMDKHDCGVDAYPEFVTMR